MAGGGAVATRYITDEFDGRIASASGGDEIEERTLGALLACGCGAGREVPRVPEIKSKSRVNPTTHLFAAHNRYVAIPPHSLKWPSLAC